MIAGYYAACENFRDNTVEKCPGQKIAEKIVEYFPAAVFIVVRTLFLKLGNVIEIIFYCPMITSNLLKT